MLRNKPKQLTLLLILIAVGVLCLGTLALFIYIGNFVRRISPPYPNATQVLSDPWSAYDGAQSPYADLTMISLSGYETTDSVTAVQSWHSTNDRGFHSNIVSIESDFLYIQYAITGQFYEYGGLTSIIYGHIFTIDVWPLH